MATINNTKGTSYPSFTIGKRGITIYQSTEAPDNGLGQDGDLHVERGASSQALYQKVGGAWLHLQISNANLDALANIVPTADYTLGTDASGYVLRNPADQRIALGLGDAAVLDTGTDAGNIPVLDGQGKLAASVMPEISITRVYTVADNTERDALDVQTGDVAIVTNSGDTFIYDGSSWFLIGVAGSVSAIQGPNGTSKSGVVSLATTDILSGVFDASQGGTGLFSYAQGDLLIGNSTNGLEKVTIGLADQILAVKSGKPTWTTLTAQSIPFSANIPNNIAATNVGDAILEAAAERAYINAATTNPTLSDDISSNLKAGDIWVNTQDKRVFVAASTTANAAQWNEVLTPLLPGNVFFVGAQGSDTDHDGSLGNPWATIGHALTVAPSGSTLVLFEGQYDETLSISHNSLTLKAIGDVQLTGKITITGQDFVSEDVKFISSAAEALELAGSARALIKGGKVINTSDVNLSLKLSGSVAAGNEFHDVQIGNIMVATTTTQAVKIFNGSVGKVQIDTGALIISNSDVVGQVNHDGGFLHIKGVRYVSGLTSTAASASNVGLIVDNVSFKDGLGVYGTLTKSGDCAFELNDVDWYKTTDLSGTRIFGRLARDIWADFTPTAYTVSGETVKNHLEGIDAKLATLGSASTFLDLSDAADYTPTDANKVLKVNNDGTGIDFGLVLGSAATAEIADFATAAEGVLATSAVQPGDLSAVATSGQFSDLVDAPAYSITDAGKALKINSTGTAIELGALATSLSQLTDVDSTGVATGQILKFTGVKWEDADLSTARVLWVQPGAAAGGNGSLTRPYRFIQEAIDATTYIGGTVINVLPGGTVENLTFTDKTSILVQGWATTDSPIFRITGGVTIDGTSTRIRLKDLQISPTSTTVVPLSINGSAGRHGFNNLTVTPASGTTVDSVEIKGSFSNWATFDNCSLGGNVRLSGSPVMGSAVYFLGGGSPSTKLSVEAAGYVAITHNAMGAGQFNHTAGQLIISNIGEITPVGGVSVASSADNSGINKLVMMNVNLRQVSGAGNAWGQINKTGNAPYYLAGVARDPSVDVLTGTRQAFAASSDDILARITPTNYTPGATDLRSHLLAIDTKLGTISTATGDKISTGTTSVQTNEVANKVTVNANGQLVATFDATGMAMSGTGNTALTSGAGEAITIHPGDATSGAGASMSISGGNATAAGQAGGHLILSPGAAGSGGLEAQVKLASGYVPTSADSVVNKSYVDSRVSGNATITIVTAAGNYTADPADGYVLLKKTTGAATQVTLPSAPATGKIITIKDAKGDAATNNITIVAAAGTIDGAANVVINNNYESIALLYNGTEWNLI